MPIPITKKIKLKDLGIDKIKDRSKQQEARQDIAEYLEDAVLDYVSQGKSPVSGGREFKPLSENYIKVKKKISSSTKPNMELYGDMLDEFDVRTSGNEVSIGFHKDASDETLLKAERHNGWTKRATKIKGSKKKFPIRRFIPKGEQNFKKDIIDGIKEIIDDYASED